eukprot:538017-Rhodomonas_salina.1
MAKRQYSRRYCRTFVPDVHCVQIVLADEIYYFCFWGFPAAKRNPISPTRECCGTLEQGLDQRCQAQDLVGSSYACVRQDVIRASSVEAALQCVAVGGNRYSRDRVH